MKFSENQCIESRVVSSGRTDRETDMTKLIGPFRNFANAPKNRWWLIFLPLVNPVCFIQFKRASELNIRTRTEHLEVITERKRLKSYALRMFNNLLICTSWASMKIGYFWKRSQNSKSDYYLILSVCPPA